MTSAETYIEIVKEQEIKRCPNGLPFEGMLDDNYKYMVVYEW